MSGTRTILARPAGATTTGSLPIGRTLPREDRVSGVVDRVTTVPPQVLEQALGFSRFAPREVVAEALQETLTRSRALVARRELGVRHTSDQLGTDGHLYNKQVHGVPEWAKLVVIEDRSLLGPHDPADSLVFSAGAVFRHYTHEDNLEAIVSEEVLIPGPWPHSYGGGERWVDLIGAFLTTPRYRPGGVLPADHTSFLDLHLLPGTGLLDLSRRGRKNEYLMIPGIPRERDWYRREYRAWVEAGRPSKEEIVSGRRSDWSHFLSYADAFEKIYAQGGFPNPSRIPIRVVGTGKVQ